MSAATEFDRWRFQKNPKSDWGLSWFISNELCKRFYASHGIVPWVISHEGLGYYGITLNQLPCKSAPKKSEPYGRLKMCGDVENWVTGSPGDHGLNAIRLCRESASREEIVKRAIGHLRFSPRPDDSHFTCRHKRRGSSYVMCYEIAAILALQPTDGVLQIWNHPLHTARVVAELDPQYKMSEYPGSFLFVMKDRQCLLAGDGRLLCGKSEDLWHRYMAGESEDSLAGYIWSVLNA